MQGSLLGSATVIVPRGIEWDLASETTKTGASQIFRSDATDIFVGPSSRFRQSVDGAFYDLPSGEAGRFVASLSAHSFREGIHGRPGC